MVVTATMGVVLDEWFPILFTLIINLETNRFVFISRENITVNVLNIINNILDSLHKKTIIRKKMLKAVDFTIERYLITTYTVWTVEYFFYYNYLILFRGYAIVVDAVDSISRFYTNCCT